MRNSIRHPLDRLSINGSAGHKIVLTADSTHKNALGIIPGLWKTQISVLTEYRRRHGSHQKPSSDCGNLCQKMRRARHCGACNEGERRFFDAESARDPA